MWCAAIVCFAFSLLLIVAGVVILIVFLAVKPRAPSFDAAGATLNAVYVGSPAPYVNGDMTVVANVSNPNQKMDVVFRSAAVELFFGGRRMAAQALPAPFVQRRGQSQIISLHMVSSQVALPPELAVAMVNQVRNNRVVYTIRGTFKVQAKLWFWHYTYWMSALCDLELTAPPSGVLIARRCSTR
uniref:Late embryogenesis abundant protein LEA-2 subgroup domain-containing protein n=1 Tax=Oryza punctata TaxID=4537 RepID=A0A0E0LWC1_ORYPU